MFVRILMWHMIKRPQAPIQS